MFVLPCICIYTYIYSVLRRLVYDAVFFFFSFLYLPYLCDGAHANASSHQCVCVCLGSCGWAGWGQRPWCGRFCTTSTHGDGGKRLKAWSRKSGNLVACVCVCVCSVRWWTTDVTVVMIKTQYHDVGLGMFASGTWHRCLNTPASSPTSPLPPSRAAVWLPSVVVRIYSTYVITLYSWIFPGVVLDDSLCSSLTIKSQKTHTFIFIEKLSIYLNMYLG